MRRRPRGIAGVAAVLLLLAGSSHAGPPRWAQDALRAAPSGGRAACGYSVLLERTQLKVSRGLWMETQRRRVVHIESATVTGGNVMQVVLEPGAEILDFRAWLLRAGEVESELGPQQVVQLNLAAEGYSDSRLAALGVEAVRPGDVLAFEASWRQQQPFASVWWAPQMDPAPVARAEFSLTLPNKWTATAFGYGAAGPVPDGAQPSFDLAWMTLPERRDERRSSGAAEDLPRLFVRFDVPDPEARLDHWEKIAAWYAQASQRSTAPESCPADLASTDPGQPQLERLRALTQLVQTRLRYVAIELGHQRWIPDRADSTWRRGYGDCKDKAAVMVSALRRAGVDAVPVMVRTRAAGDVHPGSPDPGQFDHVIVAFACHGDSALASATVTGRDGRKWAIFDPTAESIPLGMIPASIGGARALLAVPGETLVTLPEASPSQVEVSVVGTVTDSGTLRARLELWAEGPEAEEIRTTLLGVSSGEQQRRVRSMIAERWPTAHMDTCLRTFRQQGASGVGLRMDLTLPAFAYPAGGAWVMTPRFFVREGEPAPRDSVRHTPILLGDPVRVRELWTLTLPSGWTVSGTEPVSWQGPEGSYRRETAAEGARLRWDRRLELRMWSAPTSRRDSACEFLQTIYSGDHLPAVATVR